VCALPGLRLPSVVGPVVFMGSTSKQTSTALLPGMSGGQARLKCDAGGVRVCWRRTGLERRPRPATVHACIQSSVIGIPDSISRLRSCDSGACRAGTIEHPMGRLSHDTAFVASTHGLSLTRAGGMLSLATCYSEKRVKSSLSCLSNGILSPATAMRECPLPGGVSCGGGDCHDWPLIPSCRVPVTANRALVPLVTRLDEMSVPG
jgi:hypothetical protein